MSRAKLIVIFMTKIIVVKNLIKKYGKLTAVNDISFSIEKGEIFGLLGENGAGKTTTLEILEGLRKPSGGKIKVLGFDVLARQQEIKEKIGVQLQSSAYYNFLNLREILELFATFYQKNVNITDLLRMVDLEEKQGSYVGSLSGGQKQRFSIVASLINDPEVVFLDEPTTGLDPLARRHLWDLITEIKKRGKTIVITTHYMEEAEVLCDRIAIMEKGKIIAIGKTHNLIEKAINPYQITFIDSKLSKTDIERLKKLGELNQIAGKKYHFRLKLKKQKDLNEALGIIHERYPEELTVSKASLEDLFIELTGKNIQEEEND